MSSEPQTPKVTVTDESEDVTEKERSPAENAFYESFLIQSRSAIENLYASNIYHSQRHAKEVKDLERQKQYSMSQMSNKQKEMVKKMAQLQEKQEQIIEEKRKQRLQVASTKGDHRIRPHSTSSLSDRKSLLKHRPRSGSMPYLEPLDPKLINRSLSKSSENLCTESSFLSASPPSNALLSRSCEDLSTLGKKNGKVILPALTKPPRTKSIEDSSDDSDSTFITRMPSSPPTKAKVNLSLAPSSFKPEHRRGSLDPSVIREMDKRRGVTTDSPPTSPRSTQPKWVPKSYGLSQGMRGLPPV
ncbi:uncharacterized protein LOC144643562 [Oculina patagonica]